MNKRKYTQKRRAEQQAETRDRIVAATMALHQELGPAHASIKAIAERAGVQRLTVYRHFPDDAALFQACTTRWLEQNPPPDDEWLAQESPASRRRAALLAFYRYYRRTERMWTVSYRDLEDVEALQAPMAMFEAYLDRVCDELIKSGSGKKASKKVWVTLRHGLCFSTWQSLNQQGLSDKRMAELVGAWLAGIEA